MGAHNGFCTEGMHADARGRTHSARAHGRQDARAHVARRMRTCRTRSQDIGWFRTARSARLHAGRRTRMLTATLWLGDPYVPIVLDRTIARVLDADWAGAPNCADRSSNSGRRSRPIEPGYIPKWSNTVRFPQTYLPTILAMAIARTGRRTSAASHRRGTFGRSFGRLTAHAHRSSKRRLIDESPAMGRPAWRERGPKGRGCMHLEYVYTGLHRHR